MDEPDTPPSMRSDGTSKYRAISATEFCMVSMYLLELAAAFIGDKLQSRPVTNTPPGVMLAWYRALAASATLGGTTSSSFLRTAAGRASEPNHLMAKSWAVKYAPTA